MELLIKIKTDDIPAEKIEQFLIVSKNNIAGIFDLKYQLFKLQENADRFFDSDKAYISDIVLIK